MACLLFGGTNSTLFQRSLKKPVSVYTVRTAPRTNCNHRKFQWVLQRFPEAETCGVPCAPVQFPAKNSKSSEVSYPGTAASAALLKQYFLCHTLPKKMGAIKGNKEFVARNKSYKEHLLAASPFKQ